MAKSTVMSRVGRGSSASTVTPDHLCFGLQLQPATLASRSETDTPGVRAARLVPASARKESSAFGVTWNWTYSRLVCQLLVSR